MAEFKAPTPQEFAAATRRGLRRMQQSLLATSASYDRRGKRLIITLSKGTTVGFPLAVLPGLEHASPDDRRAIEVEGGGYGLHVASLDADISVSALARAAASRANGRMGGRPGKSKAA
jgi:Protein of unknown function (DUF2442)